MCMSGVLIDSMVAANLTYEELYDILDGCLIESGHDEDSSRDSCELPQYLSSEDSEGRECDTGGPCEAELSYD